MSAPLKLEVFLHNRAGRKGIPLRRSFEQWIRAALAGRRSGRIEIAVALLDEAGARALNRQFRHRDSATNVLSFPNEADGGHARMLGDLALCPAVIARELRSASGLRESAHAHVDAPTLVRRFADAMQVTDAERDAALAVLDL